MAKPSRALLIHNNIAPYRLPVFEEVSRGFDAEVWFCKRVTRNRPWTSQIEGYNFRHRTLRSLDLGPFCLNPGLFWQLLRQPFDIYLVGDFPELAFTTFATILVAKLRRKPVILWSETLDHNVNYFQTVALSPGAASRLTHRLLTRLATSYRRLLLRLPDRYVALSQAAKQFLITEGVDAARIESGIQVMPKSLLRKPSVPKTSSPYAGKTVVFALCYFTPAKGLEYLIAAMKHLPDPNLRLVVAGSGPDAHRLHRLAAHDSRIHFVGHVDAIARANYFSWANVFANPTLVDCWGFVVNEALHYGVPTVVSNVAGAAELIQPGRNGFLVPPRNPAALASAIQQVLSSPMLKRGLATSPDRKSLTDPKIGAEPILQALISAGGKS